MAEKTPARVTRLLGIVTYLEHHDEATVPQLAQHFGVSEAQIRKDVATLWTSGAPGYLHGDLIDFDAVAYEDDIIRLTDSQGVSQVRLSPREAVALIGALSTVAASGVAPEAFTTALDKLVAAVGDGEAVRSIALSNPDPELVATLRSALEDGVVVDLVYVDASDRLTERTIEPHRLVVIDGLTYVECWCRRAQDYRTLRLDRIRSATRGADAVTTQPDTTGGFSLVPQFEAAITAARPARWLLDTFPGVRVDDDGDTVTARFGVADARVIAGQLLTIGPYLRSIHPVELAQEVAVQARAVLDAQA
jgi:proteasome accessory factor C